MRVLRVFVSVILLLSVGVIQGQEPTPAPQSPSQELRIWMPDVLASPDNPAALTAINIQTDAFAEQNENVTVELRLKEVGTAGGIMPALRTGSVVAPDALPTLTLLRRQDLISAELAGLIQSMEGLTPSSIQGNLDVALLLGQANGELYGLPYMLEALHMVYRPQEDVSYESWDYNSVIERNQPFVFPAGRVSGLNDVFLLQYLTDGSDVRSNGSLLLDQSALTNILEFYELASDNALVSGFTLNYTSPEDYLTEFIEGDIDTAVFTSTDYLRLHREDDTLEYAPIPTESGEMTTLLNGWMWVIVTTDPQQQQLAVEYITWMMNTQRQAEIATTIDMLPSQRSALQSGIAGDADTEKYIQMLDNAILPVTDSESGTLARSMQLALSTVLTLENTAEQAANFVIRQTNN